LEQQPNEDPECFGTHNGMRVWLYFEPRDDGNKQFLALKIREKYEIQENQSNSLFFPDPIKVCDMITRRK